MRQPWPAALGGTLIIAVGAAGLIRAATATEGQHTVSTSTAGSIVVTDPYVRAPVPPTQIAAAYFTVYNTSGTADRLTSVETGAGTTAVLHVETAGGGMSAMSVAGALIPAHGSLTLATGKGHVMIENLIGQIRAGQYVNVELNFAHAGSVLVSAPVIAVGAPAPTTATSPSSGAHS